MVSCKAMAALLVVHAAAMLASQTEAFVPIFTYSELQRMQERERNKGEKKSLSVWQRSEEAGPRNPEETSEEEENKMIKLTAPVEIGMRMNSRQLEKYRAALEGLLSEALPGKVPGELQAEGGRASLQLGPPPTLVLIF
ncbi:Promotilin [Sciurus carolinensis]|uniref:Promotilin n=1 Tax=Sciurus carolinensis TaxID=30640 RepID=A0AA41NBX1_SCICA|nr:Promotilin [Sciurus carolinensis]